MRDMIPLTVFGAGLLACAVITAFVTRLVSRRSSPTRTRVQDESEGSLEAAKQILDELAGFGLIVNSGGVPVYANEAARERDGINGIDAELRSPDFHERVTDVLASGEAFTRESDENSGGAVRMHAFRLNEDYVVVLAEDLGEAQRVNAIRRDFIANMSHELKTPIAAIGLLAEALQEAADDPTMVRKFAKRLGRETRRLGELSRDVIRLSEAQSTLGQESLERVDLRGLVGQEVERHTEYALQHGVSLRVRDETKKKQPTAMKGRRSALGVAVSNLITNAVNHSPRGSEVEVTLSIEKDTLLVTVTDAGDGIEPEYLPRIFERFFRVDRARSRDEGGTGLGLSIVRHTMRAHGGDVDVWSAPGEGSSFLLSFPLAGESPDRKKKKKKKPKRPQEAVASVEKGAGL